MIYQLARPLLFALDPETAHDVSFAQLRWADALGLTRLLRPQLADDPVTIMGLSFRNPVGLSAGLDKNAAHIDALGEIGFGFIELGTVTPRAQAGNAKPRIFRLPEEQALINRLGFNNQGLDQFVTNVTQAQRFTQAGGIIGLNIGKNADTPIERALDDYLIGLRRVVPLLLRRPGYVTVNISSPNTTNLRALQQGDELKQLLKGLRDERQRLADQHGQRVPMAVKIAPDLADEELPALADTLVEHEVDAVIATNTTIERAAISSHPLASQTGGLSGAPLRERSTQVINLLYRHLQRRLPIIGVGGILSGQDAVEKIQAGASLVQLYTGLIYQGPALVTACRQKIAALRSH